MLCIFKELRYKQNILRDILKQNALGFHFIIYIPQK